MSSEYPVYTSEEPASSRQFVRQVHHENGTYSYMPLPDTQSSEANEQVAPSSEQWQERMTRRDLLEGAIGAAIVASTIVVPTAIFKNKGILEKTTSASHESSLTPEAATWEYTAESGDSYWGIVAEQYGDWTPDQTLSFIENNIENTTAEVEDREKVLLDPYYPYLKEPLLAGDEIVITDPTCPVPDKPGLNKEDPDCELTPAN